MNNRIEDLRPVFDKEVRGIDRRPPLVGLAGKVWVVKHKPEDRERDLLGFLLGGEFANVAEVHPLNSSQCEKLTGLAQINMQLAHLSRSLPFLPENTYLVRYAPTYIIDELPRRTAESAVAAEIVYSTWTRRRDDGVPNRDYVKGVPVFYDHGIAFGAEPISKNSFYFFNDDPYDYNTAAAWRVREVDRPMTSEEARGQSIMDWEKIGAIHYVHDIKKFLEELRKAQEELPERIPKHSWMDKIRQVGFAEDEAYRVLTFLQATFETLSSDMEILERQILSKAIYET